MSVAIDKPSDEAVRLAVVDHFLRKGKNGIATRDDLYRVAFGLTGVKIPFQPVCQDHQTPFDYLAASYFESGNDLLVSGPRGGGKTWTTAVANAADLVWKPKIEIASVGAIDKQAKRCYRYTTQILAYPAIADMMVRSVMEMTEMNHGATYEQLVGTINGVNSPHPQKVRADEVDLMGSEVLEELQMVAQGKNGIPSTTSMISSIKFADGNMSRMIDNVGEMGLTALTWCYKEVSEPCGIERRGKKRKWYIVKDMDNPKREYRTKAWGRCGECVLLHSCRGDLAFSTGWIPIVDTIKEFKKLDPDTWQSQKECRQVTKKAQFYPEWFDGAPHVIPDFSPPVGEGIYFRSWDHGASSLTVCQFWWISPEWNYYLFDEYVGANLLFEEHARSVVTRWDRDFVRDYSDPAAAQEAHEYANLKDARYRVHMTKAFNPRESGVRIVRGLEKVDPVSGKPQKFVCKRCHNYRGEKKGYRRKIMNGVVTDDVDPSCRNKDHSMDTERYGVASFIKEQEKDERPSRRRAMRKRPSRPRGSLRSLESL